MGSVRVAIVGVGNCASSLVQGVEYYRNADPNDRVPGLMHVDLRRLPRLRRGVRRRVRRGRQEGRHATSPRRSSPARTTPSRSATCRRPACSVQRGPTLDGLGQYYREIVEESDEPPGRRRRSAARRPRSTSSSPYLPVGSEEADKFYAQAAIDAGCAFVNALPVFIASDPVWAQEVHRRRPADRRRRHQVARSVPPSCTAAWRSCSRTAVSSCCARTSSTSAATWTS